MEKRKLTLCVFCGSSYGTNPAHKNEAQRLGVLIGSLGHSLVFGAGNVGLMGETARAARDAGAAVTGVLPQFLRHVEPPLKSAEELIVTPDLQQRKTQMTKMSDAFIVLPGGLGTLDEFFEVVTMTQLNVHKKPIILINSGGFYAPLVALIDAIIENGFANADIRGAFRIVSTADEAMAMIAEH